MRRSDVSIRRIGDTVRIQPEGGFEVKLLRHDGIWTVAADGWHEDFRSEERAVECLAFVLSDACRLKTWSRAGLPFRWTVEARTDEGWVEARSTGLLLTSIEGAELHTKSNAVVRM